MGNEEFNHLRPKLEDGVGAAENDTEVCLISIAISAKRQADALERIANAFDQQSATGNILYWLEIIASAANAGRS